MEKKRCLGSSKLILFTPLFVILAHYLAMLPHELSHSFMAWGLEEKTNPFALHYGGTSWPNILLLIHMDENVNYGKIIGEGHGLHAAWIAFAGAGIANGLMFALSLWALTKKAVKQCPLLFYFLFLFNLMNLGNFYDYVPIRTFTDHGDTAHFTVGLGISPWWVYVFGGYLVAFLAWHFFTRTMISAFVVLDIETTCARASLMALCVFIFFGFYGMPGFVNYGEISYFLSATSWLAMPGLLVALWPTRDWAILSIQKRRTLEMAPYSHCNVYNT